MSRVFTMILSAALAALACAAHGAETGAKSLLPADSASAFRLSASAGEFAKMSTAEVTGQPFLKALRIEVAKEPQRAQDVQIAASVDAAMASGDVLMVSFWMRSGTAGEATLDAGFRAGAAAPGPPRAAGAPGAGAAGARSSRREGCSSASRL